MDGVSVVFWLSNSIVILAITEVYYRNYLVLFTGGVDKFFKQSTYSLRLFSENLNKVRYYFLIQGLALLTWKSVSDLDLLVNSTLSQYAFLVLIIILGGLISVMLSSSSLMLFLWLVLLLNIFYFINNLLTLLLVLELIATLYYFFFLNVGGVKNSTIIKLKNLILNYLWLSLLTLLVLSYAIFFIVLEVGTVDFKEITMLSNYIHPFICILFYVSIFWKISMSGFHFFKYEIYRYLEVEIIFYFSLFSLFVNVFLLVFVITKVGVYSLWVYLGFGTLILICNSLLLLQGISNIKLFQLIALSGLNTLATILVFCIV